MPCERDKPRGRPKAAPPPSTHLRALAGVAPVRGVERLARPGRLVDRAARAHLLAVRGEVQDRGSVDRVKVSDVKVPAVDIEQAREADRELVGAAVVAVHEGAGRRPPGVTAWAAGVQLHVAGARPVEAPGGDEVGELLDALEGLQRVLVVEPDDRADAALVVVQDPGVASERRPGWGLVWQQIRAGYADGVVVVTPSVISPRVDEYRQEIDWLGQRGGFVALVVPEVPRGRA